MYESNITTGAMIIAHLCVAGGIMLLFTMSMKCIHWHALLSMGGVLVTGFAMMLFRLFRGCRTMIIKYIHMGFHLIAIGLYIGGYNFMRNVKIKDHIHGTAGYIAYGAYILLFLLAIFLFTYLYEYRSVRHGFAPIHDIAGVWMYITMVGCVISGNHGPNPNETEYIFTTKCFNIISCCGYMIVVFTVLSPYFEWELVGPI